MQLAFSLAFKSLRRLVQVASGFVDRTATVLLLYLNNVDFEDIGTKGVPHVSVSRGSIFRIGSGFRMNNGNSGNPIGRPQACTFFTGPGATLEIGRNVGMSSTALIAMSRIVVEDDVKFGGGVCVYDTDFHALDPALRKNPTTDRANAKTSPVVIRRGAFIGAHSTILKGVEVGADSVIGACSVVTRDIPPSEIWAGNPARFVRRLPSGGPEPDRDHPIPAGKDFPG